MFHKNKRHSSAMSIGGESWRSDATVRASSDLQRGSINTDATATRPNETQQFRPDFDLSPKAHGPMPPSQSFPTLAIAPWESEPPIPLENGRHLSGDSQSTGERFPSNAWENQAPGIVPGTWSAEGVSPAGSFGGYLYESTGDQSPRSPVFPLQLARHDTWNTGFSQDDRRPSIASTTTMSSVGSGRSYSRVVHKKLHGFFGEEPPLEEARQIGPSGVDNSRPMFPAQSSFRHGGDGQFQGGQLTPDTIRTGRPKTPQPSADVTPWMFQDHQDINTFGQAPIRQDPTGLDKDRVPERKSSLSGSISSGPSQHVHKHSLHRQSTRKGTDEFKQGAQDDSASSRSRSSILPSRRDTMTGPSKDGSKSGSQWRSTSPSTSIRGSGSGRDNDSIKGDESGGGKRSFFNRLRNRHKSDKIAPEPPPSSYPAPSSSQQPSKAARESTARPTSQSSAIAPNGSVVPTSVPQPSSKKDHLSRLPFKSRKGFTSELNFVKDPNTAPVNPAADNNTVWNLDTDLSKMEGIVSVSGSALPVMTPPSIGNTTMFSSFPFDEPPKENQDGQQVAGAWDAPDSWAVKRVGEEPVGRLHEIDEAGVPLKEEDGGVPHYIRIFRPDGTFATLCLALNTTAHDIVHTLGRRTLLGDELDNYHILLRKHDTSRQLDPSERPLVIQKKLLEQAGYNDSDHPEELGKEDHSYLCRFNFLPAKMSGYSSLDKDPGFNKMQKFSNVDLQGRNLITIPIALYNKSSEIVFLNISRNLSLDVPKDFIQGCTSLREIKFTSNEAWRLPPSFCLANKLTVLDVSNNRLEQLDHAQLDKLESLASLKLANNKLTSLPRHFIQIRSLRSLNISSNFLEELPSCICEISTLTDLDISFNQIKTLPNIGQLENLERLWATNNRLTGRFEESASSLRNIREIDVRFNAIDNVDVLSQLPQLEHLMAGHNSISAFESAFTKIRTLYLDHNPVTRFSFEVPVPTLAVLSLASAKLAHLTDDLYLKLPGLTKFILDKNHFTSLSPNLGKMVKLEYLSVAKNALTTLPPEIGRLVELRFLDVRENNINLLPSELWFCRKLETLNLSSNVLDSFPRPPTQIPTQAEQNLANLSGIPIQQASFSGMSGQAPPTPGSEESDQLSEIGPRRSSGGTPMASSPGSSQRKGSATSLYGNGRKPSMLSRASTEAPTSSTASRKESLLLNRVTIMFAGSLRHLLLADNRLSDEVFDQLVNLQELRILNLSYNELYEIPSRTIRRWQFLSELYLSGNDLTSLPAEDLEEVGALRVLHLNSNKFQVLPAELGKVQKLAVLDVASNSLKYNVSNWPYDWNWNCNPQLKYLNLSGNKRLEIKPPATNYENGREAQNLTDFSNLSKLRILGLMDVTLMISSVPDTTEDRRVRTSGSTIGSMAYGIADSLGRNEHLSTLDFIVPRLEGHDDESLFGMFDGVTQSHGGHKLVKFLHETFAEQFKDELKRRNPGETPADALRRTYITLNRDLTSLATLSLDSKERKIVANKTSSAVSQTISQEDLMSGAVAAVMYLHGMELYVSNVGDVQAVLIQSEGGHRLITEKHDPAAPKERARIREAGGYVSRQGKLNDVLDISRAFGFTHMMPSLIAAPYVGQTTIQESDEIILVASRELWDFLSNDFIVDLARSERGDLMRAAQKLRDLAIAFGASGKVTVMVVGVSDLRRKERARYRTHSMSMGPSGLPDDYMASRRAKRGRDAALDSKLARLDQEVDAPVGDVSLVFTDIKNSTLLWETYPIAMRSAIKQHNEVMRRHLRLIGGYEVKTEGDAFMVAFPTVTSALLWCFTIQSQLLEVQWPQEILSSVSGQEVADAEGNVLFRGLSVRMGIHWGQPVCETDPVTRRMDYFGPMVNRAARISAVADGGQITVSSDFIAEVQRLLETHIESDRTNSSGSGDQMNDDILSAAVQRELRSLSSHGFEVKDLGERRLKGLENPEYIYLMYPHSLAGRLIIQQQRADAEKANAEGQGTKRRDSQLTIDLDNVWDLWAVSLRLEMLCSTLECPDAAELKAPETALLERTRERGGEVTDRFLVNFVEHQTSRIETCITSLALRNLVRPFKDGMLGQSCPMSSILDELAASMAELKTLKEAIDFDMAPS